MIMKRIDPDDGHPSFPSAAQTQTLSAMTGNGDVPSLQYRGVPQDRRRVMLRIDSVRKCGMQIPGPLWLDSRQSNCKTEITELHFG